MPKAKTPRPTNRDEDETQSQRFLDAARALQSDGGLSPTDGEKAFERLLAKAAPSQPKKA